MSKSLRPCGLCPPKLLCPWDSPGKNTGMGCHALLQVILPIQGLNLSLLHLLHHRQILYRWVTREVPVNIIFYRKQKLLLSFPGGAVIKNSPCKKKKEFTLQCKGCWFHPWSRKILCVAEQLNQYITTTEPYAATTEANTPRACAPQQEKLPQWEARTVEQRVAHAYPK